MKMFCVRNLTELSASECLPWEFKPAVLPSEKIRGDKESRQEWYRTKSTEWQFYTAIEGANPNMRPSKDNPARVLHGIVVDYDISLTVERVMESVEVMRIKPAWIERSLGGGARIVFTFPRPVIVEDSEFCTTLLQSVRAWLNLDLLPSLDEPALTNPTRLFCNGADWRATGHGPIPEESLQAWYVTQGQKFRFRGQDGATVIPLDVVEKELRDKHPDFSWPTDFVPGSQGPSWWVAGSTSPLSAILKPEGMFTFSAHADKPFYSWADILGQEFIRQFIEQSISKATANIFWDSKRFWKQKHGYYVSLDMTELLNYFKVECGLSTKPDKSGQSMVDRALNHIFNEGHVTGAAPFMFRESGLLEFMGRRVLNTYVNRALKPADELTEWGNAGKFPFLSIHFDNLFDPTIQKENFLAWVKHFYEAAINLRPMPGQNTYLMGGADVGKTLTSRAMVGRAVGGFVDASDFLLHGASFNSELFESPLWCVDDDNPGENSAKQASYFAMMKKVAANQQFKHNKKFEVSVMTEWAGRVICTTNLDYVSSRMLGPMDDTSMDKTNIFRCSKESKIIFPTRHELIKIIDRELPFFLRWLLDWSPPDYVKRHVRYGYAAYHEPTLLDQSHQSARTAPIKELLIDTLRDFFGQNPEATEWRGTVVQLLRLMLSNPLNDFILRSIRLEQVNRYLEQIQREKLLPCDAETGEMKTRTWIFRRFDAPVQAVVIPVVEPSDKFSK